MRGSLTTINSTHTASGGEDEITLGNGRKTVMGGTGGDICLLYPFDAADEEDGVDLRDSRLMQKRRRI